MKITPFKNSLNRFLPTLKAGKQKGLRHPRRDWGFILSLFVLLNTIVIVLSAYLFLRINEGSIFVAERETTETVSTFDRAALDKVVSLYVARKQEFERLKTDFSDLPSVR